MSAQLVPLEPGTAVAIPIQQPVLLIGRHPESDVRVDSSLISRRHCCLAVVNNRVLIRDLGSRHGVQLNGVRIEEAEIRLGDEVAIGHLIYRMEQVNPVISAKPLTTPAPIPPNSSGELIPLDD